MTDHQVATNARELAEMEKAGIADVVAEARCTCKGGNLLAKFYGAPDDDGTRRLWVWVSAWKGAGKTKVPPHAVPIPLAAGEAGWTQITQCRQCRGTWAVFPAGLPSEVRPGATILFDGGGSSTSEWVEGDLTNVATVSSEAIRGPAALVLVRLESPTWGAVSSGDTPGEDRANP